MNPNPAADMARLLLVLLSVCSAATLLPKPPARNRAVRADSSNTTDRAFRFAFGRANKLISELDQKLDSGPLVPDLGARLASIQKEAVIQFKKIVPDEAVSDESALGELRTAIQSRVRTLCLRQLELLRRQFLATHATQSSILESGDDVDKLQSIADTSKLMQAYRATALESIGPEHIELVETEGRLLNEQLSIRAAIANAALRTTLAAHRDTQQAMQFVQQQQQQLMAVQQQLQRSGATPPWNAGLAYRVPNSNVQITGTYLQGKANVQVTSIPDDAAGLLGAEGFVKGVLPGNVGLSCNINV